LPETSLHANKTPAVKTSECFSLKNGLISHAQTSPQLLGYHLDWVTIQLKDLLIITQVDHHFGKMFFHIDVCFLGDWGIFGGY